MKSRLCECPYCSAKLELNKAYYLLHWRSKDVDNIKKEYKPLTDLLTTYRASSDYCYNVRYEMVWKTLGQNGDDTRFVKEDFFLSREQTESFLNQISEFQDIDKEIIPSAPIEKKPKRKTRVQYDDDDSDAKVETPRKTYDETAVSYRFEKIHKSDAGNLEANICKGDTPVAYLRHVCSQCYNIIPDYLYRDPMVKVYLIAPMGCGKTSMLYAIYDNMGIFRQKNGDHMEIDAIQDGNIDPYYHEFINRAKDFAKGTNPDPTETTYIPPVFFRVTKHEEKGDRSLVLAVYDCAGELYNGEVEEANEDTAFTNAIRVNHMDSIWCLVNTEESALYSDEGLLNLNPEQQKKVRNCGRLMDYEESSRQESNLLGVKLTIEDALKDALQLNHGNIRTQTEELFQVLTVRIGGKEQMKINMKDKHLSLILTKCDYLTESPMIAEEDKDIFFRRSDNDFTPNYFDEAEKQDQVFRNFIIQDWQESEQMVQIDQAQFASTSFHFVASRIKEDTNAIHPIRIEEPVVYLAEEYFGDRHA